MVKDQIELRNILNGELERKRLKNPRYSLRAFAQSLDLSPSALSEFLNGKRRVSKDLAARLAYKLCLAPDHMNQLMELFDNKSKGLESDKEYLKVSANNFRVISEWYHFAILSLAECDDFKSDSLWISKRLNLSLSQVEKAIERLLHLDLLIEEGGQWVSTGNSISTTDDVVNLSLRKSHHKNLELAERSLEKDNIHSRDFTAITMAIDPKKIPEAKKRIRKFRDELCDFMESDKKTEVIKFCMQMFPLTEFEVDENGEVK